MATKRGAPKYESAVLNQSGFFNPEWFRFLVTAYDTDEKTISAGTTTTITHRLTARPRKRWCVLVNKIAELGFSVGDEVDAVGFEDASDYGLSVAADATNLYVTVGAAGIRVMRRNFPIGEFAAITADNWRFIVRFEP